MNGACAVSVPPLKPGDDAPESEEAPTCQLDDDGQHQASLQQLVDLVAPGAVIALCAEQPVQGPIVVRQDVTLVGPGRLVGGPGPAIHVTGGHLVLRDLELEGGSGSPEARLDGDTHGGVLAAWDADALTLDGVRVRGGQADWGGCVSGPRAGDLVMQDSVVENCTADKLAGGVWVRRGVMTDSRVRNSQAPYGGGIAARTVSSDDVLTLTGTSVEKADGAVQGGGLLLTGPGEVWGGTFSRNTSQQGAGALVSGATGVFRDAVLIENVAEVGGGGLFVSGGQVELRGLRVSANQVTGVGVPDGRGVGGGIWVSGVAGDHVVLAGLELADNLAPWGGGLIVAGPSSAEVLPLVELTSSSLLRNAPGAGLSVVAAQVWLDEVHVVGHPAAGAELDSGLLWVRGGEWRDNDGGDVVPSSGERASPGDDWLRCTAEGCVEDAVGPLP